MIKILKISFAIFGVFIVLFAALQALSVASSVNAPPQTATPIPASPTPVPIESLPNINDLPLSDNPNVYQYDDPDSLVTIYLTVRRGNSSDNSAYTWQEVNAFVKYAGGLPIPNAVVGKDDAIVQFGDETGPLPGELGYAAQVPNATVQIRGASTSLANQKSYKIEFLQSMGMWRGQSTIDLNKHPYDDSRLRNKLNFDLLKQIPNITSLRTQFVHLYVKDETVIPWSTKFVDYGLFTQVEQPNRRLLKNHRLDPDGQLYKATFFEFYRYPDQIRLRTDPLYDVNAFSQILEIKGNDDHAKLIQMLDDVNNYDLPIQQTFEKYFNADNFFTWMAYNILVGNLDTQSQNFYLYSPHNGNKWYFLPWDYDGAIPLLSHQELKGRVHYASWENGVSNYWGMVLVNRLLRNAEYRQALDDKINELREFMTPARLTSMINGYRKTIDPYVTRLPDVQFLQGSLQQRDYEISLIPGDIEANYELYLESLKKPMPFYLGTPVISGGNLEFHWEDAYDFNGKDITYHFAISTDPEFKKIVAKADMVNILEFQMEPLKPGIYYWRVVAENTLNEQQIPFDYFQDTNGVHYDGLKYLEITSDGQVREK